VGPIELGALALRRALAALPLLLGVVVVNFALIQLAPGDPVTALIGDYPAPPGYVEQVRAEFGLDRPLPEQLGRYLVQIGQGNLGYSFAQRQDVGELILERLPATLRLMLTALVIASVVGVGLGVLAARYRDSGLDKGTRVFSMAGYSVPEFWLGQILILVFALWLDLLPSQGARSLRASAEGWAAFADGLRYLALPAFALSLRYIALISRVTRASLLEVLHADYVLAARARGARERTVLFVHALRNAAPPIITAIAYDFGFVLAGSALIETVFGWPGIGRLLFDSIARRDYPVMTAILLFVAIGVVIANLIADLLHAALDPRLRQR
jgi:peptide/nickel transport system permease protein